MKRKRIWTSTIMDSAAPSCAFDSAPSSEPDWRRWLREWLDALQPEGGAAFSPVTPPQPQSYFRFGGDVTVDDLLVGLDQDLPLPPPPSPTPPAYPSYSSGNSWLQQQLEGSTSWEELLMKLRALVPPTGAQIHVPESPAQPHAGDEIDMLELPAPTPAEDEMIHMPGLQAPPPDDAMAGVVPMIGHTVPVASGEVGADSLVSGDSNGIERSLHVT